MFRIQGCKCSLMEASSDASIPPKKMQNFMGFVLVIGKGGLAVGVLKGFPYHVLNSN